MQETQYIKHTIQQKTQNTKHSTQKHNTRNTHHKQLITNTHNTKHTTQTRKPQISIQDTQSIKKTI